jgi:hypothetical protein
MINSRIPWLGFFVSTLVLSGTALADDIRPDAPARPLADEQCIERCDAESDRCMADTQGDPDKLQACDEKYSACLQACESG